MMKRGNGVKISRRKKSTPLLTTNLVLQVLTILGIGAVALNIVFFSTVQTSPSRAPVASRKLTGDNVGVGKDVPKRQVNPQGDIPQSTVKKGKNTDGSITGSGKDKVLQIFEEAGVQLGKDEIAELPSWDEVLERIGEPIVYNTQSCARFRSAIAGVDRNMGCSGIFNTGTNLVTQLLKENCKIPERVAKYGLNGPFKDSQGKSIGPGEAHGIRWQVPWGKHMPNSYRDDHSTKWATHICKECVMPIVTVRNPYDWMKAMCRNHYTANWPHNDRQLCPNLVNKRNESVSVNVKYDRHVDTHENLAALWNDWYAKYWKDSKDPYVFVRFEDAIFHPKNVTHQICECAGGEIRKDRPFTYIVGSAKDGPGHGKVEERTGMTKAWIKYSKALEPNAGFETRDYEGAMATLDKGLMDVLGYRHPEPAETTTRI